MWDAWLGGLSEPKRRLLLRVLAERYQDEVRDKALVEQAAQDLPVEPLREVLRRIARREAEHAALLAQKIRDLGGEVPPPPEVKQEATWRELLAALESEKADRVAYLEEAYGLGDPGIRDLFARIKEEEEQNYRELLEVLSRIDPYAEGA